MKSREEILAMADSLNWSNSGLVDDDDLIAFFHIAYAAGAKDLATATAERGELAWVPLTERLPNSETHYRVLIFTDGYDFNGEQVFDVKAETLNECFYNDPEDQPEVCRFATHWMPIPAIAKLGADKKGEK